MRGWNRTSWLLALIWCTLSGCGGGGGGNISNPALPNGIQGQATRGPLFPVAMPGQADEAPLPGVTIVIKRPNGGEVARQTTDAMGNYKIGLPAGDYQVLGLPLSGSPVFPTPPGPQAITVPANQYVTVNVSYDTGIR